MRLELDDLVEVRILDHQRRHRALGDEIQLGVGMAPVQCAHEGSGEEDIADGAEPDAQDAQHAANVVARCPASPAGLACHTMPRPKSILWVDDEVDGLAAHRRFLEEQGFAVAQAAHGDDALAMLRRQPYSVVLLDEQMPGRRGLDLLPEIRAIDPAMAVVMVTQSEDDALLRDAIGTEIDDYLVKPVHPRQVLSVVTRLLEGDRIRQQRLARDFVTRFRELEGRRGGALAWREWSELVAELARWEVRLAAGDEPGLSEALRALQESLRKDFQGFITRHYPRWLSDPERDRPPLSVDVGAEFLVPALKRTGRVVFILIDCLRLDQWEVLRDLITPLFDVEESHYYSILPTATPFSRNAIFSGLFPMEIAARHPEWWGAPTDEESLNAHEAELLTEQLRELVGEEVPVRYEKLFTAADGADLLRRLPAHLAQPGVTALVFNFIDQLTHGRSENAILYEVARDADALRGLTKTWFERSPVLAALEEAERRNVPVLLTTDHGSIHCNTPATVFAKRDATANLRYKFGEDLRAEDPEAAIMVEDLKAYGLPDKGLGVRLLLATGDRFFVYPTKLREYQARYRGAFLHGGATPEEMILPVALLTPRRSR
ncbi:MAG: PglZ domain-containing protein [Gemmatimonadetes bacterium]|nr:MAG: PglZ domain-containing protein [Gemmatimonadota bacterium]